MARETGMKRSPLVRAAALVAVCAGFAFAPQFAIAPAYAQAEAGDEEQFRVPDGDQPETEQRAPRRAYPSEDGTELEPGTGEPPPPSGCNFRDGSPLELLV